MKKKSSKHRDSDFVWEHNNKCIESHSNVFLIRVPTIIHIGLMHYTLYR